jgi:EAL and modified HD-GYP domain-containing signal transduction protein
VARQAILDSKRRVYGYELLYRAQASDASCTTAGDLAASRVLTDALLGMGLDTLTGGSPAFVNFTRELLLAGAASLLPMDGVVIELREDVPADAEVVEACAELRKIGYRIALDDFVEGSEAEGLLPYVNFVKLDVLDTPPSVWQPLAYRLASPSMKVVAERVETVDIVAQAGDAGCSLFQGYYFCRPDTRSAKALPARRMAYLNLLAAINRPGLTIGELEDLVKRDMSLTVRVLKCINSAAFAISQPITSVRQALVLLGIQRVRQWASVWAMAGLNSGGTPEMVSVALLRARTCEVVGQAYSDSISGEMFLLGMCSVLDAIADQPMEQAIDGLQFTTALRDALLGGSNPMRTILDAVIAHEQGDWDSSGALALQLGLPESIVSEAYADALRWSRNVAAVAMAA